MWGKGPPSENEGTGGAHPFLPDRPWIGYGVSMRTIVGLGKPAAPA